MAKNDIKSPKKEDSFEVEWFKRMGEALHWRLITPDFTSPFAPVYSPITLTNYAQSLDALLKVCEVKCICEGYEILHAKNLKGFIIQTDHPCLTPLKNGDLADYLEASGIMTGFIDELISIQEMLRSKAMAATEWATEEQAASMEAARKKAAAERKQAEEDKKKAGTGHLSRRITR